MSGKEVVHQKLILHAKGPNNLPSLSPYPSHCCSQNQTEISGLVHPLKAADVSAERTALCRNTIHYAPEI